MVFRQTDQLAIAVGSPIAAQEHQQHPGIQMISQPPGQPGLILQGEIGNRHQPKLYLKRSLFRTMVVVRDLLPGRAVGSLAHGRAGLLISSGHEA